MVIARTFRRKIAGGLVRAATVLDAMAPFEGARGRSADAYFQPPNLGPNAAMEYPSSLGGGPFGSMTSAQALIDAVTHELGNNEIVDAGVEHVIDDAVRTGIDQVEPDTGDTVFDEQVEEYWSLWTQGADASRAKSLGDVQALFVREFERCGECGVRVVYAAPITVAGRPWPGGPALELIPSERIPRTLSGVAPNGNPVRGGVEMAGDGSGQVVAYWVLKSMPNDAPMFGGVSHWMGSPTASLLGGGSVSGFDDPALERVPAAEMVLHFYSRRAAALRGVPQLAAALTTVRNERSYTTAIMDTANLAASLGVIMSTDQIAAFTPRSASEKAPMMLGADGRIPTNLGRGLRMLFVKEGTKNVGTIAGQLPGSTFESTLKVLLRRLSRAMRATASAVSGDYEQVNFAGARMDALATTKAVERRQARVWAMTLPYYRAVLLNGLMTGALKITEGVRAAIAKSPLGEERMFRVLVTPPGVGYSDPRNEAAANQTDIQAGVKSRAQACRERGVRWRDVAFEEVEYEKEVRRLRQEAGLPEAAAVAKPAAGAGGDASGERGGGGGVDGGNGNGNGNGGAAAERAA